jgi:hypothetical protein
MVVMLMGKLRGLPAHTDVVAGFRFGRVVPYPHPPPPPRERRDKLGGDIGA